MSTLNFRRMLFITLLFYIAVPLAHAYEQERDEAFVSKVKGLGLLLNVAQTADGYLSMSRKIGKGGNTFVLRKTSDSGKRIMEKEISIERDFYAHRYLSSLPNRYVTLTGFLETVDGYVFVGSQLYYDVDPFDGRTASSDFLFKLTKNGQYEWSKSFYRGETFFDFVITKPDGGFLLIGRQYHPTSILLASFTANGDVLWKKTINRLLTDQYYSQRTSDGIILASGTKISKINDSGNIVWKKKLNIKNFKISSIGSASDNGVLIAGNVGISTQLMIIHLDANGRVDWNETYSMSAAASASTLLQTTDGGYVISGTTSKDSQGLIFFKIDAKRDVVFQNTFGGPGKKIQSFFTRHSSYFLIGSSLQRDMLFASLNSDGIVPGCSPANNLNVSKLASPVVRAETVEIVSGNLSLPESYTLGIKIVDSNRPTLYICE